MQSFEMSGEKGGYEMTEKNKEVKNGA